MICRVEHRAVQRIHRIDTEQRLSRPPRFDVRSEGRIDRLQASFVRKIEPGGVLSPAAVEVARQHDGRVRQAERSLLPCQVFDRLHRVLHQLLERHGLAGDAIDERGVGAVLEQAANEVGEQGVVRAYGRIDPARSVELALSHGPDHLLVEWLAHAVQALEFVLSWAIVRPGERVDSGQRVRVVGRELRIDLGRRGEQLSGAADIGDVGVGLARVDRVAGLAIDLRPLDLAVPVGAFHESHHEPPVAAPRQVDEPVDHGRAALLVRLDHEADAVPAAERRLEAELLEQVEREFEAVGLFRIDVQADVVAARELGQLQQPWVELGHHATDLRPAVTRVQRRELD